MSNIQKIEKNGIAWLNIVSPKADDLVFLKDQFHLSSSVLRELATEVKRPKIEEYSQYLFLVLHFPVFDEKTRQTTPTELDFIITKTAIVTVYQNPIPAFERFFNECLTNSTNGDYFENAGYLLFCMLDKLIDSCLPMLDHVHDHIEEIENKVFRGEEKEMLSEIAIVKRDIIDFRRTMKPQRSVLEIICQKSDRFFGLDLDFISQEVLGSNTRVWNVLENHKEMIEAIEQTNESLLSYQISNVMKILTILTFIAFPLNLITGFLGMSVFDKVPFAHSPYLYLIVLAFDILIVTALVLYFRKKKWL